MILIIFNSIFLLFISWKIFLIIIPILAIFFTSYNFLIHNIRTLPSQIDYQVNVDKKFSRGIIVNQGLNKIYIETNLNLQEEDWIQVKTDDIKKIDNDYSSWAQFLKSNGIFYVVKNAQIKHLGIKNSFKRVIYDYVKNGPGFFSRYGPLLMLGLRNDKNKIIIDKIKNISIMHLFTISGFHINLIIFLIYKLIKKMKIDNKYWILFIIISFLLPYLFILNFPISASRASLFSFLYLINKLFLKNKYHKLNLLALTIIIFFFINPYVIYSKSFIYSYILTYAILIMTSSQNKKNLKFKTFCIISYFSLLVNAISNDEINLSQVFTNLFFSPLIAFSYVISFFFWFLKPSLDNYYFLLDIMINIFQYLKLTIHCHINSNLFIIFFSISFLVLIALIKKPLINEIIFLKRKPYQISYFLNKY